MRLHIFSPETELLGSLNPIGLQNPELASGDALLDRIAHELNRSFAFSVCDTSRLFKKGGGRPIDWILRDGIWIPSP